MFGPPDDDACPFDSFSDDTGGASHFGVAPPPPAAPHPQQQQASAASAAYPGVQGHFAPPPSTSSSAGFGAAPSTLGSVPVMRAVPGPAFGAKMPALPFTGHQQQPLAAGAAAVAQRPPLASFPAATAAYPTTHPMLQAPPVVRPAAVASTPGHLSFSGSGGSSAQRPPSATAAATSPALALENSFFGDDAETGSSFETDVSSTASRRGSAAGPPSPAVASAAVNMAGAYQHSPAAQQPSPLFAAAPTHLMPQQPRSVPLPQQPAQPFPAASAFLPQQQNAMPAAAAGPAFQQQRPPLQQAGAAVGATRAAAMVTLGASRPPAAVVAPLPSNPFQSAAGRSFMAAADGHSSLLSSAVPTAQAPAPAPAPAPVLATTPAANRTPVGATPAGSVAARPAIPSAHPPSLPVMPPLPAFPVFAAAGAAGGAKPTGPPPMARLPMPMFGTPNRTTTGAVAPPAMLPFTSATGTPGSSSSVPAYKPPAPIETALRHNPFDSAPDAAFLPEASSDPPSAGPSPVAGQHGGHGSAFQQPVVEHPPASFGHHHLHQNHAPPAVAAQRVSSQQQQQQQPSHAPYHHPPQPAAPDSHGHPAPYALQPHAPPPAATIPTDPSSSSQPHYPHDRLGHAAAHPTAAQFAQQQQQLGLHHHHHPSHVHLPLMAMHSAVAAVPLQAPPEQYPPHPAQQPQHYPQQQGQHDPALSLLSLGSSQRSGSEQQHHHPEQQQQQQQQQHPFLQHHHTSTPQGAASFSRQTSTASDYGGPVSPHVSYFSQPAGGSAGTALPPGRAAMQQQQPHPPPPQHHVSSSSSSSAFDASAHWPSAEEVATHHPRAAAYPAADGSAAAFHSEQHPEQQQQQQHPFLQSAGESDAIPAARAPTQQQRQRPRLQRGKGAPVVAFGFGGFVFSALGGTSSQSPSASPELTVTSMQTCLTLDDRDVGIVATAAGRAVVAEVQSLPSGGSLTPQTKTDAVVTKALQEMASPDTQLLRDMLALLCQRPAFDWAKGGQAALVKLFQVEQTRALGEGSGSGSPTAGATTAAVPSPMKPDADAKFAPWGVKEGLATIQGLLATGDRREAVRCALHYRLYSHALLLSLMCETKDVFEKVVQTMVAEQLDITSPLAHAYCLFNELPLPEVPKEAVAALVSTSTAWLGHASTLVANYTRDAGEALVAWGDRLIEAGNVEAGHVCYVAAQLSPASRPNPPQQQQQQQGQQPQPPSRAMQLAESLRSKYILLGGHYNRQRCRTAFVTPTSIFLTEVLEHSVQRDNDKFVRPQLIPFRVAMACLCLELGMAPHALTYLDQVLRVLPPTTQKPAGQKPSQQPAALRGGGGPQQTAAAAGAEAAALDLPAVRFLVDVAEQLKKFTGVAMQRSQGARNTSSASTWWPFGGSGSGTAAGAGAGRSGSATGKPALVPPPDRGTTPPSQGGGVKRGSTSKPLTAAASPAEPEPTKPASPATSSGTPKDEKPQSRSRSMGWSIGSLFRRGGSQGSSTPGKKEEPEAKKMILDTDTPPEYDSVTGRWKFPKTAEEEEVERLTKSGPPKMAAPAAAAPAGGGVGGGGYAPPPPAGGGMPPMGLAPHLAAPPGMPGPSMGAPPPSKKYVDMFNS